MSTNKESLDWYNNNAKEYTAHVRDPKDSVFHSYYEKPAMYSALPNLKNKKVLSLGCGSGEDSQYLKNLSAAESVGIDISNGMIKIASNSYPKCVFKTMDMEDLSFDNESFDFIYSSLAIHYIEYWDKVLSEVYRVLKPSGYFLFSCNHPVNFAMEISKKSGIVKKEMSITRIKNTDNITVIGDYLSHKSYDNKDWPVRTWSKPIGEISEEIYNAGLVIREIIEPKPQPEMKKVSVKNYKKLSKIPAFIIFKLQKPPILPK